jgi:hypothetical protein
LKESLAKNFSQGGFLCLFMITAKSRSNLPYLAEKLGKEL